jgi:Pilus formation protein N terminal region
MRYLSFLAVVLASAPACAAEFTHTIELRPGFTERWQAPRPFKSVILGNPDIVDTVPGRTNRELTIITKPDGGSTNIALIDENGEQVANVLVTNPAPQYQPARSTETGRLQFYRNDDKCYPDCVRLTKPNDRAPTKRDDTAQSNAPQPNNQGK